MSTNDNNLFEIKSLIQLTKYEPGFAKSREALQWAVAEIERLQEIISYLPKVPTQPYEKELAQYIAKLEARLRVELIQVKSRYGATLPDNYVDAEMEKLK